MKKYIITTFIFGFSLMANAQVINCNSTENTTIKNKETLLKTYTFEYWKVAIREIEKLPQALQKKGFVVGDFHFNNMGIYYDYVRNTSEFVINDFDDTGINYLLGDTFKFISYLKKVDKKLDHDAIIGSYIQGLSGFKMPAPIEINKVLTRQQHEFSEDYQSYINKKIIESDEFDYSRLTATQKANITHFMNLRLIKRLQYVKPLFHINYTGSSQGMERYEFIGADAKGSYGVYEFKQLKCSATGSEMSQNLSLNFSLVKEFFKVNIPSNYMSNQQMYFYNGNYYLVRDKKNNPLKKLKISEMTTGQLQVYANFYANFLGYLHSKSSDEIFLNAARSQKDIISRISKKIAKEFNEEVN